MVILKPSYSLGRLRQFLVREMFGALYFETNCSALYFSPKKQQRKNFCWFIGQLCCSPVRYSTTKHYLLIIWDNLLVSVLKKTSQVVDWHWWADTMTTEVVRHYSMRFVAWGFVKYRVYYNEVNISKEEMNRNISETFD